MEKAISEGDIAWHALPFTWQTELMDGSMISGSIGLSHTLDRRFGRTTTGAKMTDVPGHTRGHTNYLIESEGHKLMLWGDLLHVPAVQFERPETTIRYDTDSPQAAATRAQGFAEAVREGYLVGGAHIPFPGLGHLRRDGSLYVWVPANYNLFSAP